MLQMKPKPGGFQSLGNLVGCYSLARHSCVHYDSYHGDCAGQTETVCPFVCTAEHVLVIIFSFSHIILSNPLYRSHFWASLSASPLVCVWECVCMCAYAQSAASPLSQRDGGVGVRLKPKSFQHSWHCSNSSDNSIKRKWSLHPLRSQLNGSDSRPLNEIQISMLGFVWASPNTVLTYKECFC